LACTCAWFSYRPSKLLIVDQILLTVIRIPAGCIHAKLLIS
jgi:hypothetical protein